MSLINKFSCGDVVDNRFHLDIRIHEGRWGDVFQATDRRNDRTVGIRFFPPGPDLGSGEAFLNHARRLSGFKAPGMSVPFDQGIFEGVPFTVNHWARGITLEDLLAEEGRFSPEVTIRVLKGLLSALGEAHELRLVHGLLRPSKIVIDGLQNQEPRVTIVDFQIWKLFELASGKTAFEEGNISRRIVRYAGPEVISKHQVVPPSDVYVVGLLGVEMLTGKPALSGNDRIALIAQQLDPEPLDLDHLPASRAFRSFLSMLLEKDPHERISDGATAFDIITQQADLFLAADSPPEPATADVPPPQPSPPEEPEPDSLQDLFAADHEEEPELDGPEPGLSEESNAGLPLMSNFDEELFGKDPDDVENLGAPLEDLGADFQPTGFFGDDFDEPDIADEAMGSGPAVAPPRPARKAEPSPSSPALEEEEGFEHFAGELELDERPRFDQSADSAAPRKPTGQPRPAKQSSKGLKDNPMVLGLAGAALLALLLGGFFMSNRGGPELLEDEEVVAEPEEVSRPVHTVRITTNPPAITIQVPGHPTARSPVDLRVRADEFPLPIRARMDANNVIDTVLDTPQDLYHIDFNDR